MSPADVERVVEAYSKLLETLDDGTFLKLESLLPYPKSKIRECLETARRFVGAVPDQFVDQEVSAMREALDVGLITLARFVPDSEVPPLRDNTVDAVLERARQGTLGAGAIRALATVVAAKAFSGSSAESTELRTSSPAETLEQRRVSRCGTFRWRGLMKCPSLMAAVLLWLFFLYGVVVVIARLVPHVFSWNVDRELVLFVLVDALVLQAVAWLYRKLPTKPRHPLFAWLEAVSLFR